MGTIPDTRHATWAVWVVVVVVWAGVARGVAAEALAKLCSLTYRMCALLSFLEEGERGKKHVLLATFVHKHVLF